MTHSKITRALPTRPDIKELQFSGARFSRGAIARLGQRLQSQYPNYHYDEAQLPDDADPDYFERFIIYIRDAPPATEGCDGELNDCLYECLKYIYGTFSKISKSIEKPEYIKKVLGLNRDAPIPVSCMDKVEQLAGSLAINIVGDITRISKIKSCTIGQFQKTKNSKSSFISVEKNCKTGIYETLEEAYQRIHEERDVFLQETKKFGLGIDLSYHNWSYKRTALWLFERFSVGIPANDPLDPIEAEWLSDAMMGGLI
ncbi:uncharacterized protein OCT59_008163 [Rhizophagus irregularis]|uniref:uncharacterized protein n=1 Tax=Rhizophagus irregularis TaxID=588596 RepID=UPI00331DF63A|nr:hypothetical protein OCT59_008163 [Rhizophagus irregularis]